MSTEHESYVPFNEQAAQEELERLQQALEESRQKRKDASAAFDQFVNSFRKEPPSREPRSPHPGWPRTDVGPSTLVRESRIAPPTAPASARKPIPMGRLLALAAIGIVAVAAVTWMWGSSSQESGPPTEATSAVPAAAEATATAVPQSPEPPVPVGTQSELRALKHVWVRVTIDGERVLERELDAGARVPLNGRSIVVRAGDAGAVRVIIDGRDRGPIGETGIAVTRTYTSSAASR
jgi:uncharacterized protein DUF4115